MSTDNPAYADDNMPSHTADYVGYEVTCDACARRGRCRPLEDAYICDECWSEQFCHCDFDASYTGDHCDTCGLINPSPNGRSGA